MHDTIGARLPRPGTRLEQQLALGLTRLLMVVGVDSQVELAHTRARFVSRSLCFISRRATRLGCLTRSRVRALSLMLALLHALARVAAGGDDPAHARRRRRGARVGGARQPRMGPEAAGSWARGRQAEEELETATVQRAEAQAKFERERVAYVCQRRAVRHKLIRCLGAFHNALGRSGTSLHMPPCGVRPEVVLTSPNVSLGASGRTVK